MLNKKMDKEFVDKFTMEIKEDEAPIPILVKFESQIAKSLVQENAICIEK